MSQGVSLQVGKIKNRIRKETKILKLMKVMKTATKMINKKMKILIGDTNQTKKMKKKSPMESKG